MGSIESRVLEWGTTAFSIDDIMSIQKRAVLQLALRELRKEPVEFVWLSSNPSMSSKVDAGQDNFIYLVMYPKEK